MTVRFRAVMLRMSTGERMPMLVSIDTGWPDWDSLLYSVSRLRGVGLASATMMQAIRAVRVAYQVFDHIGIDLKGRLQAGQLLTLGEIDELVRLAGTTQEHLDQLPLGGLPRSPQVGPVVDLGVVRERNTKAKAPPRVDRGTRQIRLIYVKDFLGWLANREILRSGALSPMGLALKDAETRVTRSLTARIGSDRGRNDLQARQGLDEELLRRLNVTIDPDSPNNPWSDSHARYRNRLIVLILLELGLRKAEVLQIQLKDINLATRHVTIARRADDPQETRQNAPHTKTKDRLLALGADLAELIRQYVHGERRSIQGSKRHGYLFVASGTGKPLSLSAVGKLFVELAAKIDAKPGELSPHVLRHTWNDEYSEFADRMKITKEEEEKTRKQNMGWSDTSRMPEIYTRRHTRRKADEYSLAKQAESFKRRKKQ